MKLEHNFIAQYWVELHTNCTESYSG